MIRQHFANMRLVYSGSIRENAPGIGAALAGFMLGDHAILVIAGIDQPDTNPSIGALKCVLDAMSISLSDFFAMDETSNHQSFYRASELTEIGKGLVSLRQVGRGMAARRGYRQDQPHT